MTDKEIFESNLQHFKISKRYGDKAQCICPAHNDRQASLTITKGKKCTLFHCHSGCSIDDVLSAAGLKKMNTFYDTEPLKANWRAYVEVREKRKIEAVYNYVSCNGTYAFTKIRLEGKKILYGMLENERFTYGLPRNTPRKSLKAIYGNVRALNKAITDGKPIFIPEGEKDVDTLTKQGFTAFTYGGVNDWQADFGELVKGADVVILADNDEPGKAVANTILKDIKPVTKSAKIIVPMPDIPKADITDYFEAGHSKEEFGQMINTVTENRSEQIEVISTNTNDVKDLLAYTVNYDKDGNIKSKKVNQTIRNIELILQHDCRFSGKIRFNEFTRQDFLIGSVPWDNKGNFRAWNSHDDSALFSIVQSEYGLNSRNDFFDAIKNVSASEKFHPIKDVLESLKWDGKEHIRELLSDYLGAENNEYTYSVMKLFMLGAVSRIYQPGCKFDYTMILQGPQGLGKSTFLQLLALSDEWFCDSLDSLDSDKAAQTLTGTWICEFGELKALARTAGGVDSVKRFLTATQDKYRMPYERRADIYLRQCVFSGTTNKTDFLQDETGNRRFLIVQTGIEKPKKNLFDISAMDDIRAAWAEAVHIYKTENPKLVLPEVVREEAKRLQSTCLVDDGKVGIIEAFLKDKQRTCAIEIWNDALQESGRPAKYQASEINSIIESFPEWQRMRSPYKFEKYGNQRGFQRIKNYKDYKLDDDCSVFVEISKEDLDVLPFN